MQIRSSLPTSIALVVLLLATLLAATGCEGPTKLPVTPNALRDGSGSRALEKLPPDQRIVDMPVIYVTDRAPFVGPSSAPSYGVKRSPSLAYGQATVSLEPAPTWDELVAATGSPPDKHRYRLAVSKIQERGKILLAVSSLELRDGDLALKPEVSESIAKGTREILDMIHTRLAASERKDVYIYVHGVANNFDDAMCRAAVIWHFTGRQGAMIAYAWPAGQGGLMGYFYDRESGEYTVLHLKRLIARIAEDPAVERLHLIAHSRGCDVTTTALRELNIEARAKGLSTRQQLKLETLVLAAADLDSEVFGMRLALENMAVIARRFVVYFSSADQAVGLSDWLFSSKMRLGTLSHTAMRAEVKDFLGTIPNLQLIQCNVSGFGTSHDYVFTDPAALSDLILVLRDRRDPGLANGRPLTSLGGAFWKLDNTYACPKPTTASAKPK